MLAKSLLLGSHVLLSVIDSNSLLVKTSKQLYYKEISMNNKLVHQ